MTEPAVRDCGSSAGPDSQAGAGQENFCPPPKLEPATSSLFKFCGHSGSEERRERLRERVGQVIAVVIDDSSTNYRVTAGLVTEILGQIY